MIFFCSDQYQTHSERTGNISTWLPRPDRLYKVISDNKSLTHGCVDVSWEASATLIHIVHT